MASRVRRDRPGTGTGSTKMFLIVLAVIAALCVMSTAYKLGGGEADWNPLGLIVLLFLGKTSWPTASTGYLAAFGLAILGLLVAAAVIAKHTGIAEKMRRHRVEKRLDSLARTSMINPHDVPETDPRFQAATTRKLAPNVPENHPGFPGVPVGTTVVANRVLRMMWEWVALAYAGTRMGKTAGLCVPAILTAPGAVIATSNKPDIFTDTQGIRRQQGTVWLLDLQGVVTGNQQQRALFWFNPLRGVRDLPAAKHVMDCFVSAAIEPGSRPDAYFDPESRDLFGAYILAAAMAGGDLLHVTSWLRNTQSQVAPTILDENGYHDLAESMRARQRINSRQRDGFYGMARRYLTPLDEPRFAAAIVPNQRKTISLNENGKITVSDGDHIHNLPELNIARFVRSTDTIYALSEEGPGSAAAIGTALIGAVFIEAKRYGRTQPNKRLPMPLLAVLDEAANVCRLRELPKWYSYFGSQGINAITILQSPSQAVDVWGEAGAKLLSDAANLTWYGGNVDDKKYLGDLAASIGDHYVETESMSVSTSLRNGTGGSSQRSWQRERIMDVSDLEALPHTRAIVKIGGSKPLLVKKDFWFDSKHKHAVTASKQTADTNALLPPKPHHRPQLPATAADSEYEALATSRFFDHSQKA